MISTVLLRRQAELIVNESITKYNTKHINNEGKTNHTCKRSSDMLSDARTITRSTPSGHSRNRRDATSPPAGCKRHHTDQTAANEETVATAWKLTL